MDTKTISGADAFLLSAKEEDHFFDRKSAKILGAKLQKTAVAFANADGGEIYVGIADPKDQPDPTLRWQGAAHIEDYNQHIQALTEIQPALPMELSFLNTDGKAGYVLKILVEKSQSVHKTADGSIYQRKGAQSLPITDPSLITALSFAKGAVSYEDSSLENALAEDVVDSPFLGAFLTDYSPSSGPRAMSYPPETLWEIVVNALIHRDYSMSDDVQILIFDNRIEVLSPGRLPGFVNKDNILDVRYARNPRIVGMLSRYKTPPNKDIGEGLNTAFQKMKEWKLRNPEIVDEGNYVRVIIPHAPLATPQEAIVEFLKKHGTVTNRQARDITGIKSENAVKREFIKLKDGRWSA